MYTEQSYVLAGLRAGVRGYVLKANAASSLVQAVRAVSRDDMYLGLGVSQTVVDACLSGSPRRADPLSGRERGVLQLIAEGRTMKEIGSVLGISPRTAETHRTRIMHRLQIHDVAGLVRYAIEQGLSPSGAPGEGQADQRRTAPQPACAGVEGGGPSGRFPSRAPAGVQ
jgi:DNA-binding NarL/FixJ family response regulator